MKDEELNKNMEKINFDSKKVAFINAVHNKIGIEIENILRKEMEDYKERFGFDDEDKFLWLSSDSFTYEYLSVAMKTMKNVEDTNLDDSEEVNKND